MYATIFLLFFLLFVPKEFKKLGIKKIIENQRPQGIFLIVSSKIMWWFTLLQISIVWLPEYTEYTAAGMFLTLMYHLYVDRKYLFLKLSKKPSV